MTSNGHIPILLKEVTKMLVNDLNGTYVDCTVGLGGHSSSILNKLNKNGFLIGIELDPYALSIKKNFQIHIRIILCTILLINTFLKSLMNQELRKLMGFYSTLVSPPTKLTQSIGDSLTFKMKV